LEGDKSDRNEYVPSDFFFWICGVRPPCQDAGREKNEDCLSNEGGAEDPATTGGEEAVEPAEAERPNAK